MNVNFESLKKTHGENAEKIFRQVAQLGGFGDLKPDATPGGLDISGLPKSTQERINKLIEAPKKEADKPAK